MGDTYKCAACGKTFNKGWSDEEAKAEADAIGFDTDECDLVCDDCHKMLMRPENLEAFFHAQMKEVYGKTAAEATHEEILAIAKEVYGDAVGPHVERLLAKHAKKYRPEDITLSFKGREWKGQPMPPNMASCLWCKTLIPSPDLSRRVCPDCDSKYMSYAEYEEAQERRRTR